MRYFSLFSLMFFISLTFAANQFGYSQVTMVRTWTISSDGSQFDLKSAFGVNNANQHVISITTDPKMNVSADQDGVIWVHYVGSNENNTVITAKAIVDIDYNTNITYDPPLPGISLNSTPLTQPSAAITSQAQNLSVNDSSLLTVVNLVNWVHSYITYDIDYWGEIKSAQDVFNEKRGVCIEYTYLLISMARSLGFDTRYVSGYVYAGAWQPHAWAEINVPGYGWLPADPTFDQVGILDDTHMAVQYTPDQATTYDILTTEDANTTMDVEDNITTNYLSSDTKNISVNLTFDPSTYVADVQLSNDQPYFAFGSYSFLIPNEFGGDQSKVILLNPYETTNLYQGINYSLFQKGYSYKIPASASFDDSVDEETFNINTSSTRSDVGLYPLQCLPSIGFVLLFAALLHFSKNE